MDWSTVISIGVLVVLALVMMRGGRGMAGCCGMGSRHPERIDMGRHHDRRRSGSGNAA